MTTLTDATTAELAENDLVAVPRDDWTAMQERQDEQDERINRLESELDVQSSNVGGCHSRVSDLTERVDDLEAQNQQTEGGSGDSQPGDEASTNAETPLEQIVSLPEHVAARELSANQERARFVAKDAADYGRSVPAGIRLESTDIRRVLSAAADDGETIYRTTVKRVMDFLADLGGDEVKQRTKRGKSFVVLSDELVGRLARNDVCYGAGGGGALRAG